ncbi:MAG: glutamate racemase [Candidatus Spechtbacterales bacterium]|nr:glutamate racemase [Candidatus Spechtbacterales bacterium]
MEDNLKIGMFDSGIGGFSIYSEIQKALPGADIFYIADQKYFPYGTKSTEEIQERAELLTTYLKNKLGVDIIVVACNTATVSALSNLRKNHPDIKFVGTVPAVKVCAAETRTGSIGVLCTPKTANSTYQKNLIKKHAGEKNVLIRACPGLVEKIEKGDVSQDTLEEHLYFFKDKNIDSLALGCSHFPLIRAEIQNYLGSGISIVDPAPAIAKQTKRIVNNLKMLSKDEGSSYFYTTGTEHQFNSMIKKHLNKAINSKHLTC